MMGRVSFFYSPFVRLGSSPPASSLARATRRLAGVPAAQRAVLVRLLSLSIRIEENNTVTASSTYRMFANQTGKTKTMYKPSESICWNERKEKQRLFS